MNALFKKSKKKDEKLERPSVDAALSSGESVSAGQDLFKGNIGAGALKGFYISEKGSLLNSANQYVFKVVSGTNKSEIKKNVEKAFDVKVRDVRVFHMPLRVFVSVLSVCIA